MVLVFLSIIADGIDLFTYRKFMSNHSVAWFDSPGWKLSSEYFFSFPGNLLTILGLAPWGLPLIYLSWPGKS
jgi:hypothetical protein